MVEAQVVIVGHVARKARAEELAARYNATLFLDDGSLGEWQNHRRAIASATGTHLIVMQDDAEPIDDFLLHAQRAIEAKPDSLISFYVGTAKPLARFVTRAVERARAHNAGWLTHSTLLWGVCIAIPTSHIPSLLQWCDSRDDPYDHRIGQYYRVQAQTVHYTWPSLVDHTDDGSLLGHGADEPRKAHQVGVQDTEGCTVAIG